MPKGDPRHGSVAGAASLERPENKKASGGCGAPPDARGSPGRERLREVLQLLDADRARGGANVERLSSVPDRAPEARPRLTSFDRDGDVAVDAASAGFGVDGEPERGIDRDRHPTARRLDVTGARVAAREGDLDVAPRRLRLDATPGPRDADVTARGRRIDVAGDVLHPDVAARGLGVQLALDRVGLDVAPRGLHARIARDVLQGAMAARGLDRERPLEIAHLDMTARGVQVGIALDGIDLDVAAAGLDAERGPGRHLDLEVRSVCGAVPVEPSLGTLLLGDDTQLAGGLFV